MQSTVRLGIGMLLGAVVTTVVLLASHAYAQTISSSQAIPVSPQIINQTTNHYIQYQAQVFNPNTGQPQANQTLAARFTIYGDANGSNALWFEDKQVQTNVDGSFTTQIGSAASLNLGIFDGRNLYLGVSINGEEPRPLQPISYAPYAIYARNADSLDGFGSHEFTRLVAYGFINDNGSKQSGTDNFSSERGEAGGEDVYLISISGVDFQYRNFTTLVTPACGRAIMTGVGSAEGRLVVDVFDQNGNRTLCNFQFAVFPRP